MINRINIIGAGNVATHLAMHLSSSLEICSVYSRQLANAQELAKAIKSSAVCNISDLCKDVDLNVVIVKDDAVELVVVDLPRHIPVVHTSGSIPIDVFEGFGDYGILYPLQTFSKKSNLEISDIPFLIEANSKIFEEQLIELCKNNLSQQFQIADSEMRSDIHLAAVMSNNFMTALLSESESILKNRGLDLSLLKPLLEETLRKSFEVGPKNAQTGPAKRKDSKVISAQTEKITDPKLKMIYTLLSEFIMSKNS